MSVTINNDNILNSKQQKLLGVTIDNEFSCLLHVRNICKQASKKLHALSRVCKFMTQDKRRMIMKAFIDSQLIFHGNRGINNTMNKIHKRTLRMVYNDDSSSYDELLLKDNTFTIHQRNTQKLAVEILKFKHNLAPAILNDIFQTTSHEYNLRGKNMFKSKKVSMVFNGTETVMCRAQHGTWFLTI